MISIHKRYNLYNQRNKYRQVKDKKKNRVRDEIEFQTRKKNRR